MPATITYACGCTRVDWSWTLCEGCSARIGRFGTCLGCGGPADEQWTTDVLPDDPYCSKACAEGAAILELHD